MEKKINFQPKVIKKDKEEHFILIKGKIYQDELSTLNIYAPKCKGIHIHKRKFTEAQSTHHTPHNNSRRLQHPTVINEQIMETKTKHRHSETNRSYETNEFNRYIYIEHFILKQKDIPSSQHLMVPSPKLTI